MQKNYTQPSRPHGQLAIVEFAKKHEYVFKGWLINSGLLLSWVSTTTTTTTTPNLSNQF
jgi:hypothetical protein